MLSITFFKAYTKLCRGLCFSSLFMNNLLVRHAFFRRLQQILNRGVSWNWGFQHLLDLACYVISPANSTVVYRQVMFIITWMSHNNMSHDKCPAFLQTEVKLYGDELNTISSGFITCSNDYTLAKVLDNPSKLHNVYWLYTLWQITLYDEHLWKFCFAI